MLLDPRSCGPCEPPSGPNGLDLLLLSDTSIKSHVNGLVCGPLHWVDPNPSDPDQGWNQANVENGSDAGGGGLTSSLGKDELVPVAQKKRQGDTD